MAAEPASSLADPSRLVTATKLERIQPMRSATGSAPQCARPDPYKQRTRRDHRRALSQRAFPSALCVTRILLNTGPNHKPVTNPRVSPLPGDGIARQRGDSNYSRFGRLARSRRNRARSHVVACRSTPFVGPSGPSATDAPWRQPNGTTIQVARPCPQGRLCLPGLGRRNQRVRWPDVGR